MVFERRGEIDDVLKMILWIVFFVIAAIGLAFLIKKLTGAMVINVMLYR